VKFDLSKNHFVYFRKEQAPIAIESCVLKSLKMNSLQPSSPTGSSPPNNLNTTASPETIIQPSTTSQEIIIQDTTIIQEKQKKKRHRKRKKKVYLHTYIYRHYRTLETHPTWILNLQLVHAYQIVAEKSQNMKKFYKN
jgi:hypothetical protein